jgi:uncharacterized integral membrane protein
MKYKSIGVKGKNSTRSMSKYFFEVLRYFLLLLLLLLLMVMNARQSRVNELDSFMNGRYDLAPALSANLC